MSTHRLSMAVSILMLFTINAVSAIGQDIDKFTDAIRHHNLEKIHAIMSSGVDLNARDLSGETPISAAIRSGMSDFAMEIVSDGANVNSTTSDGVTALMQAAWNCNGKLSSFLLDRGAGVDARNTGGYTALMQTAYNCTDPQTAISLIKQGANVNVSGNDGETPLTLASSRGNDRIVKCLLAAGADIKAITAEGETALSLACKRKADQSKSSARLCKLLRDYAVR